jgi:Tol biopolymer transport system component
MRRGLLVIVLWTSLLCVACDAKRVKPTVSPFGSPASPLIASSATATLASLPTPTPLPTITPTSLPTATPTPVGIAPPLGLIYHTQTGLWRTEANDSPTKLIYQGYTVAISPDGNRALAIEDDSARQDLWLVNLNTDQRRNLTENLDRVVCCPVWWPSRPDWVLFGSWPLGNEKPDTGSLSAARLDGTEYRILDTEGESNTLPAPSSDGHTIAYDRAGSAWLYDWDTGPKHLDPAKYGLSNISLIANPVWSPDGKSVAWEIGRDLGQVWQAGIAVFDLETKKGRLLHVDNILGGGDWLHAPVWSPDGQWLAFIGENQDETQQGVWIANLGGYEKKFIPLKRLRMPVWSLDGRWLAAGRTLYEVGTWQSQLLDLPPDAEVVAWINPAPQ